MSLLLLLLKEENRLTKTACSSSLGSFLVNQTQSDSTAAGQYDFLRFLSQQTRNYKFTFSYTAPDDNPDIYIGGEEDEMSGDPRLKQDYLFSNEEDTSPSVFNSLFVAEGKWRCIAIYGTRCDGLCEYSLLVE